MRIADGLRRAAGEGVQGKAWKRIERILWEGRKSLSLGLSLEGFGRLVNDAFAGAGRLGLVLGDVFVWVIG